MKWTTIRPLAAGLLLGAVTTTAVSWYLAVRPASKTTVVPGLPLLAAFEDDDPSYCDRRDGSTLWLTRSRGECIVHGLGRVACLSYALPRQVVGEEEFLRLIPGHARSELNPVRRFDEAEDLWSVGVYAVGWPYLALRCEQRFTFGQVAEETTGVLQLPAPLVDRGFRAFLPYYVIPIGFAADTALYGAAWLCVLVGPRLIRQAVRRRRGECVRCGYPAATSPVCTECGAS